MSTEDEQARHELAASLTDKELIMGLWLHDEVKKLNTELMDMMALIWPGELLAGMSMTDIWVMLQIELARRQTAKSQG
jgi:hypothetical protein